MRILKWIFLVLAVVLASALYVVFVSFSDHHEYSSDSLLNSLLTPTDLIALSKRCDDRPSFVYRSADGPKPTIVTMSCTIAKHNFERQMNASGFQYINSDLYKNQDVEIQVTKSSTGEKITSVTFIGSN